MSNSERLIYLPLGGAGEIGMNAYIYGYGAPDQERLVLVDLGVTFPDMETTPGVDLILPDMEWLIARKDRLEGIFVTHGHEDHLGAVGRYARELNVPIYARAFTAELIRNKLKDQGLGSELLRVQEAYPSVIEAGPFQLSFAPISHSVPESSSLVIDSPAGRIVHSGDFKLDQDPVIGEAFDPELWQEIAASGIHAYICDSTNIFSSNPGRSEGSLAPAIQELLHTQKGMVVATTFASNVARLKTLAEAGHAAGRSICLMGRAMLKMTEAARKTGVLTDFPEVIPIEEVNSVPREKLLLIVTGSQGERRAASAQLARGSYRGVSLKEGDLFLFSSRIIPGNERGVIRIMNQLSEQGVEVMDEQAGKYHVSGHANRPDLERMHQILKPRMVVPCHGEHRHLREHAKLARQIGAETIVAPNGSMVLLSAEPPSIIGEVESGRRYLDGNVMIGARDGVVRDRIRMALGGQLTINLMLDDRMQLVDDVWCDSIGLPELDMHGEELLAHLEDGLTSLVSRLGRATLKEDDRLENELRRRARQICQDRIGKKPETSLVISRME